ncbi:hypothetical protein [Gleimia hominis]|uniref:hypothetical protein n=1 Tax=Gleimia hominis TaxID=595468 RepID=UPI00254399AF|nr:hypothetical protein [Gleimia hominis]WIK63890.1 hypothetical protein CJ187_006130 [Gleimia hominis]
MSFSKPNRPQNNEEEQGNAEPDRIPISERMAKLDDEPLSLEPVPTLADLFAQGTPQVGDVNQDVHGPTLTVTQAGALQATDVRAAVDVAGIDFAHANHLDPAKGEDHHLLLVHESVDPRELEALAVSIWDDAGWVEPGVLRLTRDARLRGPWRVDNTVRRALGTPTSYNQAWVVDVAQTRTAPAPEVLRKVDDLAAAFPKGMPTGFEFEILEALRRIARRLAGAIRINTSGRILEPDADSAVTMSVFSPRWVEENDLTELLKGYLPDIVNVSELASLPPIDSPQRVQTREEVAKAIDIPENEFTQAAEVARIADEKAAQKDFVVRGYALVASAGNTSRIQITATPADYIPPTLRFEQWPQGRAVEYQIMWIPPQVYRKSLSKPGRAVRLERIRVKDQIESLAGTIARATAGQVLDEDHFLVAFE